MIEHMNNVDTDSAIKIYNRIITLWKPLVLMIALLPSVTDRVSNLYV